MINYHIRKIIVSDVQLKYLIKSNLNIFIFIGFMGCHIKCVFQQH